MKYTVVVGTRDIMAHYLHTASALKKLIGWQALFEGLLPHLTEDIDDSFEGMYQYLVSWQDDGMELHPLNNGEMMEVARLFSALFRRLRERSNSLFLTIPKGFVHTVQIEGWVGLDLILAFSYTQPSYSVGGHS